MIAVLGHDEEADGAGGADGVAGILGAGLADGGAVVEIVDCPVSGDDLAGTLAAREERAGPLEAVVLASTGRAPT
ncbi:MAG: hypothetical protein ACRDY1_13035, partial [Acidimicrobiales bacterium]